MDIRDLLDDYGLWHETMGHSPKTITWYRWILTTFRNWLEQTGRSTHITEITISDVRLFLQAEAQRAERYLDHPFKPRQAGKLSDRTLHGYVRAIRAFFGWLVEENYLRSNPVARLKPPKLERRLQEIVSPHEVERLLAELNPTTFLGARMYAMIGLLYDSGLRLSELLGLDVHDIRWGEYQVCVTGKGKQERLVPFSAATSRILRKYLTLREPFTRDGEEALFISTAGSRLTADAVQHALKRLGRKVGISRVHPHLFRHSAAVAYLMNGGNQSELRRILGHKQLSTTDIYASYTEQQLAEQHKRFSPMMHVNGRQLQARGRRKQRGHK